MPFLSRAPLPPGFIASLSARMGAARCALAKGAARMPPLTRHLWKIIWVATALKLWLTGGQKIFAIGNAGHDDALFLALARHLGNHTWLGPYSQFTLMKGPFYPMWVAAVARLGLPLFPMQHLLYAGACMLLVKALAPLVRSSWALLGLYLVLLYNPITYGDGLLRVVREGIYPALTLTVVSAALGLAVRRNHRPQQLLPWAGLLGVALGAFWLAREEGAWLMPTVIVLLAPSLVQAVRDRDGQALACLALPFLLWGIALGAIATKNLSSYGIFTTAEFKHRDFVAAYGALARPRPETWVADVQVSRRSLQRLYEHSGALRQIRPALEAACDKWSDKGPGGDVRGGWFIWALRDAVCRSGHCTDGAQAMAYYERLAVEVNQACADGKLECYPERASMMPQWHAAYFWPAVDSFVRAAALTTDFRGIEVDTHQSGGRGSNLVIFRDLTRGELAPLPPDAVRRSIDQAFAEIPLPAQAKANRTRVRTLAHVAHVYAWLTPPLVLAGLAGMVVLVRRHVQQRRWGVLLGVQTALLLALGARWAMLALIDVASFPAVNRLYLSPAVPLALIFCSSAHCNSCQSAPTRESHQPARRGHFGRTARVSP